ncbi:MAG: RNaseH [Wendovervirus sonii]|uniref:RNaseH n=1 Tax=phage Lak_Megaphage_Sonny TaxID=3109229 RepID=A0ABZ0Z409_9CAUD|nr:MAG: RNaseH [phage Lak_Megaphage_Sonny]
MESNKTILCLDWSNLLFRSLFINQIYGHTSAYDNIEDCRSFIYKFATDVCSIINIFKPNNVILLTDSQHAWRKDILPGENGYKSNRQKAENVNWDNIYKCSDDLKEFFYKTGFNVAEVERGEADDIAALCKETIFSKYPDYNMIIVSADADLRQLIDFNPETKQYCAVYNTTTKGKTGKRYFYVSPEFYEWYNKPEEAVDIFFGNMSFTKQYLNDILSQNNKIEIITENPDEILLHKIFCGDDGDCVPSFYEWVNKDKFTRITPSKEKKIKESLNIHNINDLLNCKSELHPVFESVCKKKIDDIDVIDRLHRQRVLVELNSELFPEHIRNYKNDIDVMCQNVRETSFVNLKAAELLKGSEYENANQKKAINADVFKDMAKYGLTDMSKIF